MSVFEGHYTETKEFVVFFFLLGNMLRNARANLHSFLGVPTHLSLQYVGELCKSTDLL